MIASDRTAGEPMTGEIGRIFLELKDIEPRIWRRFEVSLTTNLRALHEIIQVVMPWEGYHLYQFTVGERVYGEPDPEGAAWGRKVFHAKNMRISALVERGVTELDYTYDFGESWQHRIVIEDIGAASLGVDYPQYLGGERTAPPEDVGGPPGFMAFVEALANRRHPEHKDMVRWIGGPFNPVDFNEAAIASIVRDIAHKRMVAVQSFEKSRQKR